ncbi:LLM class flavin-dependent oxidoreductase [Actinophytocola oryzae]|uniref:Alkanesulfonate monooxygenase SsuD/methylene tetrahydromethanopterin reductase-like flavin-dependent oxidoreductase (Luciferase family) n=1 Tax=Actinophytocola oryzae TaxID=502181 RepID=A0A4R7VB14_9PSEU|nr:LLM class flavin-dependent oxidoreductase [Actinophytocola oryzae]TDV46203.1 alkanesulfonate monooxygenase SsuD/methylene tetrahydromethanopterin reductase-like flavin-dependent oxidoreductase (luciferase family) [Actinophytocola oryzae]
MTIFGAGLDQAVGLTETLFHHARLADDQGLDLVSVSDHPYFGDRLDAYAAIGVLLGRTSQVSGLVNVTNAIRQAPMLARTVTTLSAMTGGRIVLGMGAGGSWEDIARLGARQLSPAEAVRAFAESITVVRLLSGGGEPVTFEGEFHRLTDLAPAETPTPPIWTGSVGPRSLKVTGELADGWIPGHAADWLSTRYRESRPIVDEAATGAGRTPEDVATIYNLPGRITKTPLNEPRVNGRWAGGDVGQWVEELTGAVLEHRAGGFILFPADDGTPVETVLGRWAREIAPAVREAVSRNQPHDHRVTG